MKTPFALAALLGACCSLSCTKSRCKVGAETPTLAVDDHMAPKAIRLTNVKVFGQPEATTVRIVGNRIEAVGNDALPVVGGERVIDGHGGELLPGFHDAHIHMLGGGMSLARVDVNAPTMEEALARVKAYAADNPNVPWIQGRGWQYNWLPPGKFPTAAMLDAAVADRPVLLRSYDGHSAWTNTAGLKAMGLTKHSKDPADGTIVRGPDGKTPEGTLLEGAMDAAMAVLPPLSTEEKTAGLRAAMAHVVAQGITAVDDIESDAELFDIYLELERAGQLPIRVNFGMPLEGDFAQYEAMRKRQTARVRFTLVKGFVDGVIESRTAFMVDPYAGGHKHERGKPLIPRDTLFALVAEAHKHGFQVALHCIGDGAVRLALDAYANAKRLYPDIQLRHRIEHIEVLNKVDLPRFAELGVVASMMPYHAMPTVEHVEDDVWAQNIGPARYGVTCPWRMLLDAGAAVAFGSDWPITTSHPLRGAAVAMLRQDDKGRPPAGWHAELALDAKAVMRAYAVERGEAAGPNQELGLIAPGQLADLVLLGPGASLAEPTSLWPGTVALVVADGKVVHDVAAAAVASAGAVSAPPSP